MAPTTLPYPADVDAPVPFALTAAAWHALAASPSADQSHDERAAGPPSELLPLLCGETRSTP